MRLVKTFVGLAMFTGALMASGAAFATPVFTLNPTVIPGNTAPASFQASDISVFSDSLINQTGLTQQTETGWATVPSIDGLTNNGAILPASVTGLNSYGLYFTYTAVVNGITFSPGSVGTIGAGNGTSGTGFGLTLHADIGNNDIFNPGATGPGGGTAPFITGGTGNDIVLAVLTSQSGSAGFQGTTLAPTINALENFVVCDGVLNQGYLGGMQITGGMATGCTGNGFDARTYFTAPTPFYNISFISATAGSGNNLFLDSIDGNATLNSVVADVNFVPEPLTISLFGAGLIGVGALRRRKAKKA
jgi:hypothetical protein